jgi:hypothetical protein
MSSCSSLIVIDMAINGIVTAACAFSLTCKCPTPLVLAPMARNPQCVPRAIKRKTVVFFHAHLIQFKSLFDPHLGELLQESKSLFGPHLGELLEER